MTSKPKAGGDGLLSKTIDFLRFPMIAAVLLIHSNVRSAVVDGRRVGEGGWPLFNSFDYLVSDVLAGVAVPLFFFISGCLFFRGVPHFTAAVYAAKLRKRVRTLLIPYVFWNLAVILLLFCGQTFLPELTPGRHKLIADYGFRDWAAAFWNVDGSGMPVANPLWFIRDLMVMTVCSPLVWFFVRKLRCFSVLLAGAAWLLLPFSVPGFSLTAVFFFTAGAFFGIEDIDFAEGLRPGWKLFPLLYLAVTLAVLYFRSRGIGYGCLLCADILLGMAAAVSLSAHFIAEGKWRPNLFLSKSSFFIYAYHGLVLGPATLLAVKLLHPHTDGMLIVIYLFVPAVVIGVGLLAYSLLCRLMPRTTALVTGGR